MLDGTLKGGCARLEIKGIMLPRNIKHADRHNLESHRSKSRRVWPCSASPWSQISLAKISDFRGAKESVQKWKNA